MDKTQTIELTLLPSPGNNNVTFMQITTDRHTFTTILTNQDAQLLQTSGLLNLKFSKESATTLVSE